MLCIKGENYQPDHAAFLSILRNEGISSTDCGSATPHCKPYNNVVRKRSLCFVLFFQKYP